MVRYPDDGSKAIAPPPLKVGERVKLDGDRRWWTIRAVTAHFAALTRQVAFAPGGTNCYTVLDWRNGVRGPCNLIGQGYGDGSYSEAECTEMLAQFEAGGLEVSQRNWGADRGYRPDDRAHLMETVTTTPYGTVEYFAEMLEGHRHLDQRAIQLIDTALISAEPAQQVIWVRNVLTALRAAR